MSWDIPNRINLRINIINGGELIGEATREGGCFLQTRDRTGVHSSVILNYDQVMELKFWLAMNVGNNK